MPESTGIHKPLMHYVLQNPSKRRVSNLHFLSAPAKHFTRVNIFNIKFSIGHQSCVENYSSLRFSCLYQPTGHWGMPLYQQLEYDSLLLPQLSIFHALPDLARTVILTEGCPSNFWQNLLPQLMLLADSGNGNLNKQWWNGEMPIYFLWY